jgi:HlyD family secretion protein
MKKIRKRLILLSFLATIVVGIWSLVDSEDAPPPYRTATVTRGTIAELVTANGTLNPIELANVGTQVSGKVEKIYVQVNDEVKKGQLLAEIDPSLLLQTVKQSKASLDTARLSYEQAERDLKRTRTLVAKDYVPKVDLERAEQGYASAKNGYESAKFALEREEVNLSYTKSPRRSTG